MHESPPRKPLTGRGLARQAVYASILVFVAVHHPGSGAAQSARVEVGLIGDLPYTAEDEAKFPALLQAMNEANLAFVVHVGDIEHDPRGYRRMKSGMRPCSDEAFRSRKALFDTSKHPFILTPGDNDWTDCHLEEPSLDPIERLARLRQVFFDGDRSLGQRTLTLTRQSSDPNYGKFRENVRWIAGDVVFVTLHMIGSNDNVGISAAGDIEATERKAANLTWLREAFDVAGRNAHKGLMILTQANPLFEDHWASTLRQSLHIAPPEPRPLVYDDFLRVLEEGVRRLDKPVALVHGNTHYFRIDQPLFSTTRQRMLERFTRVEVFGTPNVHWVRGIVDGNDPQLFTFRPEIVGKNLVSHIAQ